MYRKDINRRRRQTVDYRARANEPVSCYNIIMAHHGITIVHGIMLPTAHAGLVQSDFIATCVIRT